MVHSGQALSKNGFQKIPLPSDLEREIPLAENARTVLRKRYLRRGEDGQPVETEQEMFWRVAYHVALPEADFGGDVDGTARRFYDLLTELRFFPNSPTFTGAGTPLGQLAACFVLGIDDDMGRSGTGIFETLRNAALIQQTGGGNGFAFSRLRPKGAIVKSSNGQATGPVGFLRVYDQAFGEIAQGGCVVGSTLVATDQGNIPIKDLVGTDPMVYSYDRKQGQTVLLQARDVRLTGRQREVYRLQTGDGFSLVATIDHPIMVDDGTYQALGHLKPAQMIMPFAGHSRVENIEFVGREDVYDLEVPQTHNFAVVNNEMRGTFIHNSRRGANMAVLRVDHPDVREFITCKTDENHITNFNISVGITDKFMQAVEDDGDFELVNPQDGKVWETVRARDLFDLIVKQAHHNGEPGVLFLDAANRDNPVPHLYQLESTNPCGEQFLGDFENCCLGSINLARHITAENHVDWEKLRESIEISTRFLEDVVSANKYVPAVPQLQEAAYRVRRIGLGIMGLADLMYALGVRYGSVEGQEFGSQVMEFVRFHAMRTSIELAKERGPFPAIEGSIFDAKNMTWEPPKSQVAYTHDWGRPKLSWSGIVKNIKKYGIRNGAVTTVAPTGTISTVAGCEGYGCEPVFALAYMRHVNDGDKRITLQYTSPQFERALHEAGLSEAAISRIIEQVNLTGTCQGIKELPESIKQVFVVSGDVTADEHVRMQAALQVFTDNAISKCVTADTLVLTSQGLVPIDELSEMRLPDQFEPKVLDVVSPVGSEQTDAFYYGGFRETRRIMLSYGYEIEGTPNHRIQVLMHDGQIQFVRLEDLKLGDTAVLYAGQQVFGPGNRPLPEYTDEWRTYAKRIHFPERMSVDLAYVLGCISSEGSISRNGVAVCNGDYDLLERLGMLFKSLFGLASQIYRDKRRESVFSLQVNSRPLRDWLLNNLKMKSGARNKIIPSCILGGSRQEIVAFLRGLFLDSYMIKDGRMFGIGLASQKLIRQLQVLLLNFGVFSRVVQTTEHAWVLTVAGEALEQLAAFVEFDEVWKNERIAWRHEGRQQHLFNFATLMPQPLSHALREMQGASTHSLRSLYGEENQAYQRARVNLLQGHRIDRQTATAVYQHFQDTSTVYADTFFACDAVGQLYVEVEAIETGYAEVFDLSVPGSHSFIANGLGNHNTCNFPVGATEKDVAEAYILGWKLGCKGLTVYVTGSRDKVVLETAETAKKKQTADEVPVKEQQRLFNEEKKPRPRYLSGKTYRVQTPLGVTYVTVNENGEGKGEPFEVFMHASKAGSETAAVSEALGRLISYALRITSPVSPRNRIIEMVRQLNGIGGGRPIGFGPGRVRSLPDGIAQVLQEYLDESTEGHGEPVEHGATVPDAQLALPMTMPKMGDLCPECGAATLVNEEGCRKCYSCGFSEC